VKPVRSAQEFAVAAGVSRETLAKLERYADLLLKWQPRINLVAPDTLPTVWHRHFLDSAQLLPLIPESARQIVDLGSGAGFPGLVLALCGEGKFAVDLYEADSRKAAFLASVIRETKAPAQVIQTRLETTDLSYAHVITARALAPLPALLEMAGWHDRDIPKRTTGRRGNRGLLRDVEARL